MNKKHMLTRIFIFNMLSILLFVIFVLPTCAESNNIMPEETVLCDVSDQNKMIDQIETLQSNNCNFISIKERLPYFFKCISKNDIEKEP